MTSSRIRMILIALAGVIVGATVVLSIPAPGEPPPADEPSQEQIETVRSRTLLAWVPARLPDDLPDRVARVDGVERLTVVRSGTAWLDAWADENGRTHTPPPAMQIPLEVAAIDVASYIAFVPEAERVTLAELDASNGIVLGRSGATLRGILANGSLRLGGADIGVIGVVDDSLIGAHEAVVTFDRGRTVGITRPRYLLIEVDDRSDHEVVADQIRSLARDGEKIRVRSPGETPEFRHGDAVLPIVRLKEAFGEFAARNTSGGGLTVDRAWRNASITTEDVPVLGRITCHGKLFPQLRAAMEEIVRRGLGDELNPGDSGGCFSPRFLSQDPGAGLSHHSWGVAFDINVSENPFGREPTMDDRIVDVMERWGFAWGGRWLVPDGMHFEYMRPPLSPKG